MSLWKLQNALIFTVSFIMLLSFAPMQKRTHLVVFTWELLTLSLVRTKSSSGYFTCTFTGQMGELKKLFQSRNRHAGDSSCCNF